MFKSKGSIFLLDVYIFVSFFMLAIIFLKGILFSNGMVLGCDWGMPYTKNQIDNCFSISASTWYGVNLGTRNISVSGLYFYSIMKLFSSFGVTGEGFIKIMLLMIFTFAGFSMYKLQEFFGCKKSVSFFSGIIYITTPIFFNYTIMGWQFVLLTMALFPMVIKYFVKAVKENTVKDKLILGILIFLSIQSQSIVWYFVCFCCLSFYLINNKNSLQKYLKIMLSVVIMYLVVNAYWLLGILLFPEINISGGNIINSGVSLGADGNFFPINIFRLFGSLYNFQYEHILVSSKMDVLYFIFPLLAFSSLSLKENKKLIVSVSMIAVFPFLLYLLNLNRDILLYVPFSNVIRQLSRFTTLSSFAYPVLIGIFLNYLFNKGRTKIFIGWSSVILILLSVYPWWTFKISDWKEGLDIYQRFRTKEFPKEYFDVENIISSMKLDQKALFLPLNGTVDFEDDVKFHGPYQEAADIFAGYSNIPGVLVISDRQYGYSDRFVKEIRNALIKDNGQIEDLIKNTNIKLIVIRKNMLMENKFNIIKSFDSSKVFIKCYDTDKIVLYKKADKDYLQHFYISAVEDDINKGFQVTSNAVAKKRNEVNMDIAQAKPVIEFKKINATKYRIVLHNVKNKFRLVFSETFHEGWKTYVVPHIRKDIKYLESRCIKLYGNIDEQASFTDIKSYIDKGYISSIGDIHDKCNAQSKPENNKIFNECLSEHIGFVSKNYNGSIQNDNLKNGRIYETWFLNAVNPKIHELVNGYANSWIIDPENMCFNNKQCLMNPNGSYDMELVVEFYQQRVFYIGFVISFVVLLISLMYVVIYYFKRASNSHGVAR